MIALRLLFTPIAFALGFLGPLFAQSLTALGVTFGDLPNLAVGLAMALLLGGIAQYRGGWLWHSSKQ
ncbi:MAG: hypothetical protein AAGI15_05945 [Pseudomonadota bacterium]